MDDTPRRVVIGVGNEYRRDDGFGPRVLAELDALRKHDSALSAVDMYVSDGEPARMLDLWTGAELAVVIDAVQAGDEPSGQWLELALHHDTGLPDELAVSSHGIGLGTTVALGKVLDRLPNRLVVLAVFGRDFGFGPDLSAPVASAVRPVTERARQLTMRE
jgi:hydrogenase maturation protease